MVEIEPSTFRSAAKHPSHWYVRADKDTNRPWGFYFYYVFVALLAPHLLHLSKERVQVKLNTTSGFLFLIFMKICCVCLRFMLLTLFQILPSSEFILMMFAKFTAVGNSRINPHILLRFLCTIRHSLFHHGTCRAWPVQTFVGCVELQRLLERP